MDSYQFIVEDLTKFYNGKKVLDIPHLTIKRGLIHGVIGPNGSGKTTLLTILSFLVQPSSGRIIFNGLEVSSQLNDELALRREIAVVLQNPFLFNTTVEKNVAYGLKVRGMNKNVQKEKVSECLDLVGLAGFERRRARELSGGEAQRVAIARGIALNPEVLFLDEPATNVDNIHVEALERIIGELNHKYGTTVILTTHDVNQTYRIADDVIVLFEGEIKKIVSKDAFRSPL
ncbi:MAG: phosphate ABC transporter ATP-binding protein [Thermodesulfobacteriota bacterium]|nr:phosphate ABC transporter ATP-binding protein [Thermodesulfobacteriota bacterium]